MKRDTNIHLYLEGGVEDLQVALINDVSWRHSEDHDLWWAFARPLNILGEMQFRGYEIFSLLFV